MIIDILELFLLVAFPILALLLIHRGFIIYLDSTN